MKPLNLAFRPLTRKRWSDFENLFGASGACGGCWCMWWRLTRSEFTRKKGEGNRRAIQALVDVGTIPGFLAYDAGQPVGWCAVEPRERYSVLGRSRVLKPIDDSPVWSVVCFFVRRGYRGRGVATAMLKEAVRYVRRNRGTIVEGYPVEPRSGRMPDAFAWTGLASAFRAAGFVEVARPSPTRPIMRFWIRKRPV